MKATQQGFILVDMMLVSALLGIRVVGIMSFIARIKKSTSVNTSALCAVDTGTPSRGSACGLIGNVWLVGPTISVTVQTSALLQVAVFIDSNGNRTIDVGEYRRGGLNSHGGIRTAWDDLANTGATGALWGK